MGDTLLALLLLIILLVGKHNNAHAGQMQVRNDITLSSPGYHVSQIAPLSNVSQPFPTFRQPTPEW
jgi:hypothetical protein